MMGGHRYLEVRIYRTGLLADALVRAVSRVVAQPSSVETRTGTATIIIPFPSLKQRTKLWDRLNCDPEWAILAKGVRLCEMTIYQRRLRDPQGATG
jgi:hypothetical protein